jgi:hypothetical protein
MAKSIRQKKGAVERHRPSRPGQTVEGEPAARQERLILLQIV